MLMIGVQTKKMHPTRSEAKVESFTLAGKICRKRALLESERRFFNDETEETFAESNTEIEMNLTDREKATLLLDPRTTWSKQVLDDATMWNDFKDELKCFHRACRVQITAFYRENV